MISNQIKAFELFKLCNQGKLLNTIIPVLKEILAEGFIILIQLRNDGFSNRICPLVRGNDDGKTNISQLKMSLNEIVS